MQRSRIEALLASFPKLADSGTQHTTVEQDNVRYVYQPLDELYMVLITNRQSNILQDIDSLHLFAQVVTSICKSLDEREILRNAFELLSAFDELVTLGYRENLTLSQIKTFLEMESHEERIQEIIARVRPSHHSDCNQLTHLHRTRNWRLARSVSVGLSSSKCNARRCLVLAVPPCRARLPILPTLLRCLQQSQIPTTPTRRPRLPSEYQASGPKFIANCSSRALPSRGKGMQLGKKSKTNTIFEQVKNELGPEAEASSPLVSSTPAAAPAAASAASAPAEASDRDAVHITTAEGISAQLDREGLIKQFEVKGDLQLRISDPSLTLVKLDLALGNTRGAQLITHPKVDKTAFRNAKTIQLADTSKGFPSNMAIGVMKWKLVLKPEDVDDPPITFRVWVEDSGKTFNITVEYEWTGTDPLKDVSVTIPYSTSEPAVSSFDAVYEVAGDSLEWNIGLVDDTNASGSFEFEASADSDGEFFPMKVRFSKTKPFIDVDVSSCDHGF